MEVREKIVTNSKVDVEAMAEMPVAIIVSAIGKSVFV